MAALLTYYGFLSLFPLLLVGSSLLQIISFNNSDFRQTVINHATQYFPALGQQLQANLDNLKGPKIILFVSILITFWGAKGIADIFQYALNHIWGVPRQKRPGFVKRSLKSLGIVLLGGTGFIAAAFLSGLAAGLNHDFAPRLISVLVSVFILSCVFWALFKWGLAGPKHYEDRALVKSAVLAAVGIQILQMVGLYLVTRQLGRLNTYYGTFGATLALLFWIYLQSQVVIYAAEAGSIFNKVKFGSTD